MSLDPIFIAVVFVLIANLLLSAAVLLPAFLVWRVSGKKWLGSFDIFSANAKGKPKGSSIVGAAALTRFCDQAAADRLFARLPDDFAAKARESVKRIIKNPGSEERPCARYSGL